MVHYDVVVLNEENGSFHLVVKDLIIAIYVAYVMGNSSIYVGKVVIYVVVDVFGDVEDVKVVDSMDNRMVVDVYVYIEGLVDY